jgi:hypothetical protein
MAKAKLLLARIDTFTKAGRYVPRGMTVSSDEVDFDPKTSDNLTEAPEGAAEGVVIEMSAIAPTGPNPKNPQQIAPGTVQTTDGYVDRGARLVGEVTLPEKQRIEVVGIDPESTVQDDVSAALEEADADAAEKERARRAEAGSGSTTARVENDDDALVDGKVADVTARISSDMADADLDRLEAAENDREKPRTGVLSAIEAERTRRTEAASA